jgi:hypothetical protein
VGTVLNFLSALVLLLPFFFVYDSGKLKFRTRDRIKKESATIVGANPFLAQNLFFSRTCATLALPLLIVGTTVLVIELI